MNVAIPINEMQKKPGAERKRKILIVEDEFVNREILIAILGAEYEIIAEGVETAEQLNTLREMGCDMVQGYYFSAPKPAADFEKFIREWLQIKEPKSV